MSTDIEEKDLTQHSLEKEPTGAYKVKTEPTESVKISRRAMNIFRSNKPENMTMKDYITSLAEDLETVLKGQPICIVGDRAFYDVSLARGEAIMQSAATGKHVPVLIAMVLAEDKL